ncbi:MAG TPA: ABC transporter substrate-binding protein [Polyangiaceae bacterium]|jgi:phospholipid transport system substrate-binding protein|nr:ABC transporter substrate-binding protein [Polyangiaceae bacterium]
MSLFRRVIPSLTLAVFLAALSPTPAWAGPDAEQFIKDKQGELTTLLKRGKATGQDGQVAKVFDTMLDYQTLAQDSLNEHWSELSDQQKKEFSDILKRLVQRAYRHSLDKTLGYDVSYRGHVEKDSGTLVQTQASNRTNNREEPISIDYLLRDAGGQWLVVDIVTEGSSLVKSYRSQFNRIIKKEGFDALVRRMKAKLDS